MTQQDRQLIHNPPSFTDDQVRYIELIGTTDHDPGFNESERKIFARVGVSLVVKKLKLNNQTQQLHVRPIPT
jgi:hypothetical protein